MLKLERVKSLIKVTEGTPTAAKKEEDPNKKVKETIRRITRIKTMIVQKIKQEQNSDGWGWSYPTCRTCHEEQKPPHKCAQH